jgi:hypothetical protein
VDEFARSLVPVDIEEEMRSSYMDYSMSVIIGRALPDVRDGLKPVHRRILYAMFREGNLSSRRYSKCAGVVGEVLKKYHPHGDSAVYDALVRMAQPWNMRYVLVDGQGNFGSVDGDPAAAYRYTESRMSPIAEELLADIDMDTVGFQPNFDGSTEEPDRAPVRVPEPARQRIGRHRRRHGDEDPAAQPARGDRRADGAHRRSRHHGRRAHEAHPGSRLPDRRERSTGGSACARRTSRARQGDRARQGRDRDHGRESARRSSSTSCRSR